MYKSCRFYITLKAVDFTLQNEELQRKIKELEELKKENEELKRENEELKRQTKELQRQTKEVQQQLEELKRHPLILLVQNVERLYLQLSQVPTKKTLISTFSWIIRQIFIS